MADQTHKPQGIFSKLMASTFPKQEPKIDEEKTISDTRLRQEKKELSKNDDTTLQSLQEVTKKPNASMLASKQDSSKASKHASMISLSNDAIESIRKVVKNPGKEEVLYVRLTKEEKDSLADVSYTYKRQGIRTSDNEVVRVAINALLEDYKINGANSLLEIVISSLHD